MYERNSRDKQYESEEELGNKTAEIYGELLKDPVVKEALDLLDNLPEYLKYHNKEHTLDVLHETILFALADGAGKETILQQARATAWYDTGYIKQYEKNEPIAVGMFRESEAFKHMTDEEIKETIANILDTQLVMKDGSPFLLQQRSKNGYLLDGDLSHFGQADFFDRRAGVAEELKIDLNDPETNLKSLKFVMDMLKNYDWKTESARRLRQAQKEINIKIAEENYKSALKEAGEVVEGDEGEDE